MIEAQDRPTQRVLPGEIGDFFTELHRSEGVDVRIGVLPNTGWLEGSGLTIDNGVLCDESLLAAPGVVAAGDVARWLNPLYDEVMRVEQWENAIEQGEHAARRLLVAEGDAPVAFAPVPW